MTRTLKQLALAALLCLLPALGQAQPATTATTPPPMLSSGIGQWLNIPLAQPDPALCPSSATPPALSLRLNGLDTGLQAVGCDATPDRPSVTFRLSPDTAGGNASIDAAWQAILHNPWQTDRGHFVRSFELKLLKADGTPVQKSQTLLLTLVTPARLYAALSLIAAVWLLLFQAGRRTSMLRDSHSSASGLARPYSLARVQMAWWFALIFAAYVLLWTLTRDWVALTPTTLALLGISGATSLAASGIDQSANGAPRTVPASAGFFTDILTDVNGITLARLQLLLWNVTLGLVFVSRIFADLRIPELDTSTLGLLGLSAGAYVGFKVPEQQATADGTAAVATSPAPADSSDPKAAYGTE